MGNVAISIPSLISVEYVEVDVAVTLKVLEKLIHLGSVSLSVSEASSLKPVDLR